MITELTEQQKKQLPNPHIFVFIEYHKNSKESCKLCDYNQHCLNIAWKSEWERVKNIMGCTNGYFQTIDNRIPINKHEFVNTYLDTYITVQNFIQVNNLQDVCHLDIIISKYMVHTYDEITSNTYTEERFNEIFKVI